MAKPVCRSDRSGAQTVLALKLACRPNWPDSQIGRHQSNRLSRVNRWASLLRAARVNRSKRGGDPLPGPVGWFGALQNQWLIAGRVLHFQAPGVQGDAARVERHG